MEPLRTGKISSSTSAETPLFLRDCQRYTRWPVGPELLETGHLHWPGSVFAESAMDSLCRERESLETNSELSRGKLLSPTLQNSCFQATLDKTPERVSIFMDCWPVLKEDFQLRLWLPQKKRGRRVDSHVGNVNVYGTPEGYYFGEDHWVYLSIRSVSDTLKTSCLSYTPVICRADFLLKRPCPELYSYFC